ncbi:MAG: methyl-accepting chemotaxis protein [Spirochaetota bacterium]
MNYYLVLYFFLYILVFFLQILPLLTNKIKENLFSKDSQKQLYFDFSLLFLLADKLNIMIMILDTNGYIQEVNTAAKERILKSSEWLNIDTKQIIGSDYCNIHESFEKLNTQQLQENRKIELGANIISASLVDARTYAKNLNFLIATWTDITFENNRKHWQKILEGQLKAGIEEIVQVSVGIESLFEETDRLAIRAVKEAENTSQFANNVASNVKDLTSESLELIQENRSLTSEIGHCVEIADSAFHNSQNMKKIVNTLQKATQEVNKLADQIRVIMKQTSLLTLNARIEASHAGEYGAGFSIIAEEVAKLTKNTSMVAQKIDGTIDNINEQIPLSESVIQEMEDVIRKMKNTVLLVNRLMNSGADKAVARAESLEQLEQTSESIVNKMTEVLERNQIAIQKIEQNMTASRKIKTLVQDFEIISRRLQSERVISPSDVFREVNIFNQMVDFVLQKKLPTSLYAEIKTFSVSQFQGKKPENVLRLLVETTQKCSKILNIPEIIVSLPKGTITPTQVIHKVLYVVKVMKHYIHETMHQPTEEFFHIRPAENKTPNDVFAVISLIQKKLDFVLQNANHKTKISP